MRVATAILLLCGAIVVGTGSSSAQSHVGGPAKQTSLGGPVPLGNPVVALPKGRQAPLQDKRLPMGKR